MTAKEIRESFKKFFESKQHLIVPSAPMVIKDDPTLMFTNAGMNQFKDIILGNKVPQNRRQADSQKCLRVSGKHNDLEEVGHDTYHHTMFEMLGNWSFGDYFKSEAIDWAWEYLVDILKLDPKDLYATVFEGSAEDGLERDNEAASIWERHLPKDHILNGNKHDNFWEMGDTGPCGPCSEIHLDSRTAEEKAKVPGSQLVNKDDPQVIEIWNLVFMQYNRKADDSLEPLPAKVIDTGMGFERLVRAMQGKHSNYDTDVFQPIIQEISRLSNLQYGQNEQTDIAMRVVADHLRAVAFSIADGQLPSNAKAGYVIRRILRRAVRYAYTFLNQKEAFLYRLLPVLISEMGDAYPELPAQRELIGKVIMEEEESFLRTLANGIKLLNEEMAVIRKTTPEGGVLNGEKAFTLFDTFGFPLDLTELICRENGMTVDGQGFEIEMEKQKARARNAAAVETGDWIVLSNSDTDDNDNENENHKTVKPYNRKTNSNAAETTFVGYDYTEYSCHITKYRQVTQKKNTYYQLILDQTPFYGEMGGQVGDQGVLVNDAETIEIFDTKRENGVSVHLTKKMPANPEAEFMACVDIDKRNACAANHSATHLLDQALKEVLGEHVEQKGSYVSPDMLRFDFSHFEKVSDEQLRQVERLVNERIREDLPLQEKRECPIEEAKKMGAIALFGEKYGDKVRVVQFGKSIEFCGGVHTSSTGRIGMFKITSEGSVAAGIRRIEAITGVAFEEAVYYMEDTLKEIRALFNNAKDLKVTIEKFLSENSDMKKEIEAFQAQKVEELKEKLLGKAYEVNGIKVVKALLAISAQSAKDLAFKLLQAQPENLFVALGTYEGEKPLLTVMISQDVVKDHNLNAGQMVREAGKLIQGGGGGQPHFATAGGKNKDGLSAALDKLVAFD